MADRVVHSFTDGSFVYFVWDSGWLVGFNTETKEWEKLKVLHPNQIATAPFAEPNRELAPDVGGDDE